MANMTFGANLLPKTDASYSLGSDSLKWNIYGSLIGNADTATKLGTSTVGSASLPIYLNGGTATACTASSLFSALSWTAGTTSGPTLNTTIAGQNRTSTIPSASASASGIITTGDQTVAGIKRFSNSVYINTNTATTPLYITRNGGEGEAAAHTVDDSAYTITYTNDETSSNIRLRLINTDTESGNQTNTTDYSYYFNSAGQITGTSFTGNATSATKATQDESGNNIKANYASSFSISDHTITLKNKNGASLGTVTVPDNNTTYSAGTGISLSGTTFSNSGVRSIATGSSNGTISVNTNGTSADVAVKGLGSAAYTASTAYAAASHTHSYLPLSGGTMTGQIQKAGSSQSWIYGRVGSALYVNTLNGYSSAISIKTNNGTWDIGAYDNSSFTDKLILSFATDANYTAGTNSVSSYTIDKNGNYSGNAASATNADTLDSQHGSYYTNASNISSGTLAFARLPSMYWANVAISSSSSTTTVPSFSKINITDTDNSAHINFSRSGWNYIVAPNGGYIALAPTGTSGGANSRLAVGTTEVIPGYTTNTVALGNSSYRWKSLIIGTADTYGSSSLPIYWNAGVPTACSTTLGVSITGNAATASKLGSSTVGSTSQPIYLSSGTATACSGNVIYYAAGPSTDTAGTWTGTITGLTAYYDGLTIVYVPAVAGASTTTLNINSLGAKTCYLTATTKLTTHFAAGQPIIFTYYNDSWKRADYDSNSNTVPSAHCTTAAATAAKAATCSNYGLLVKSYLHFVIRYSNTSASALTMNVNSTGAKPIYINGSASSSTNYTLPLGSYLAYYDGTNWYFRTDGKNPNPTLSTTSGNYGATLPTSAIDGQIFFQTSDPYYEIPTGGSTGQALVKTDDTDRNVQWATVASIPSGGTAGQVIMKNSSNDNDFSWSTISTETVLDNSTKYYVSGSASATTNSDNQIFNSSIYVNNSVLYGAAWNDYAEYRELKNGIVNPGNCVVETGDDTLILSSQRMQPGAELVSDTFGFAIGETEKCKTPIAATGRVLAYPYEERLLFKQSIGRPVCSGPNGTVSIMTDEEYATKGYCAIGFISAVPDYEEWGEAKVKVNGRVWIRVR